MKLLIKNVQNNTCFILIRVWYLLQLLLISKETKAKIKKHQSKIK